MISLEDGRKAVEYARGIIEWHVSGKKMPDAPKEEIFNEKMGAFVTLNSYPSEMLRGCIGIPEPIMKLKDAIKEAAVSACHDPRFPPLRSDEIDSIIVEVSILTKPAEIKVKEPEEYIKKIKVGRDGLIAEQGFYRGLLLPQVAVEYGWNALQFLEETCMKAGLMPDCWRDRRTKIYSFQAHVFSEVEPWGKVVRKIDAGEVP